MQMHSQQPQLGFNFDQLPASVSVRFPNLPLCPSNLLPDAVVALDEPSLQICDMEIRDYLRQRMSFEQMSQELDAMGNLARAREEFGDRAAMGVYGSRAAYGSVFSATSEMDWMHQHELKRCNQIKLAMPTTGEEADEARLRIQARIAARKARHQQAA